MDTFEYGLTADELEQKYYEWLVNWIPTYSQNYSLLLRLLYDTPFRVTLLMDENRVGDGLGLRTRFVYEHNMSTVERDVLRIRRPCSILEVMIALGLRFEEEYMSQQMDGYDTLEKWFGPMIQSLGLMAYDDHHFEQRSASLRLVLFLDRNYLPDGNGGLFYIPGIQQDMREIEIWQQMFIWWDRHRNDI